MTETQTRLSHRLSVVWFTDLVGYSTLAEPLCSDPRFEELKRKMGLA